MPRVIAEVLLRSAQGAATPARQEIPTARTIEKLRPGDDVLQKATHVLERLGFEVLGRGPLSITVIADAQLYERVFDTRLARVENEAATPSTARAAAVYFKAERPVTLPSALSPYAQDVIFPRPAEIFP